MVDLWRRRWALEQVPQGCRGSLGSLEGSFEATKVTGN
jgi:hypothetical protein